MPKYAVPYTAPDGTKYEIPVEAASPAEAGQLVQESIDSGTLQLGVAHAPPKTQEAELRLRGPYGASMVETPGIPLGDPMRPVRETVAGVNEGLTNFVSGVEGLANDTWAALVKRFGGDEKAARAAAYRDQRRQANRVKQAEARQHNLQALDAEGNTLGRFVGETMPWFYAPAGASTYLRTVAQQFMVGGVAGAAMTPDAKDLQDRLSNATYGALFGGGLTAVAAAPKGALAYVGRRWKDEFTKPSAQELEQLETYISEATGKEFHFSAGQLTGDPTITSLEFRVRGGKSVLQQNQQLESLVNMFTKRAQALSKAGSPTRIAMDLQDTVKLIDETIQTNASAAYGNQLEQIISKYGEDAVLTDGGRDYLAGVQDLIARMGDDAKIAAKVPEGLVTHARFIDERLNPYETKRIVSDLKGPNGEQVNYFVLVDKKSGKRVAEFHGKDAAKQAIAERDVRNAREGKLTPDEVVRVMQGHNEVLSGERALFENYMPGSQQSIGAELKAVFLGALETKGNNPAFTADMERLRQGYHLSQVQRQELGRHALGTIFGPEAKFDDVGAMFDRFLQVDPEAMGAARMLIERFNPQLLKDLKSVAMKRIVQASINPASRNSISLIDPVRLANALAGPGEGKVGRYGAGLFDVGEQTEIVAAAKAVRALNETYQTFTSRGTVEKVADASINIIARTPEFFARWMVRTAGTSESLERLLLDKGARQALMKLADEGPTTRAGQAAITYLSIRSGEWEAENQQRRQAEANEQQLRRAPMSGL